MNLRFEWDTRKALTNQVKHGVLFEEAKSVFTDPLTRTAACSSLTRRVRKNHFSIAELRWPARLGQGEYAPAG